MKRRVLSSPWLYLLFLSVFLCPSCTREGGNAPVPKPLDLGSKDILGYVAIPSLDKILQDASAVGNLFAPGKTTPEKLKAQLGSMLGDPQLSNMEMEKPVVVLILKAAQPGAPPSFAAMIPAKQGATYDQALTGMGMQARFSNGLLLAAQTPDGIEAATKVRGVYEQIAGARIQKSGRLYLQIAGLMEAYGPMLESQLDNFLKMMPTAPGMAGNQASEAQAKSMAAILKLEAKGLLAILNQCEAMQVDLELAGQSIGIDQVMTAKPGTALAESCTKSSRCASPSTGLIEGGGLMTGALSCDAKSFTAFFKQVIDSLSKEPEGAALKEGAAIFLEMAEWWGGTTFFSIRPGKDSGLALEYDIDVLDEAKCLAAMEKALALLSPGTALSNLYKEMGFQFSIKLEKAAREHAGIPVHQWKISMDAKDIPGMDMSMMKAFMKDMELALVKGHGLMSNDPSRLDSMIDQVQSSAKREFALRAQKAFGPGRQGYFDYDVIGLLKVITSAMSEGPAKQPMEASLLQVKSTEPLVFAMTFGEGRAQLQMNIPLGPFAQMVPHQMVPQEK